MGLAQGLGERTMQHLEAQLLATEVSLHQRFIQFHNLIEDGGMGRFHAGEQIAFAITLRTNGTLIGGVGLRRERDHNRAELGFWLGVPYWGNGYATEAARAVLRYGFESLGLHRIQASHFSNNPASGAVLRKIGMQHEASLREHILKWEQYLDLEVCAVLKAEYKP